MNKYVVAILAENSVAKDHLPRAYTPQIYEAKCEQVYQHVFESYGSLVA